MSSNSRIRRSNSLPIHWFPVARQSESSNCGLRVESHDFRKHQIDENPGK